MKLFISLALIVVACITTPVTTQRWVRQQQQQQQAQYCVTPENYYGSCVTLSFCPQIANVFQTTNQRQAQQYVILSQRACGTRNINGDPVVCCTRPLTTPQTTSRPQRQTQRPQPQQTTPSIVFPNTQTPRNPFIQGTTAPVIVAPPTQAPIVTQRPTFATSTNGNLVDNKAGYCRGPDLREGSCTPIKECQPLVNELLVKQTDPTFATFLQASNRICGNVNTNVCCPSSTPTVTTKAPLITNSNEIPRRLPTVEEGCGYSNNSYKKIVGGEVSKKGAWPWVALLGYDDELSANPFKCGGALVTARHVVTAAHCLRRDLTFVRLGEHDLTTDTEARHVDIKIARMEKHPDYNPRNGHSDIAILYLERNVQFTDTISPICMPYTQELKQKSYINNTPIVIGWGKTMEGGISSNVLQELQIPIYENQICRHFYQQQNRVFTENQFDKAVLCAGALSGGMDTCQGDSGGPLMMPEKYDNSDRFYLIGVVSYGIGCGRPMIPGVYASAQYFMDWITKQVAGTVSFNSPPIMNSNDITKRLPTLEEGCGHNNHGNYRKPVGGEVIKKGSWPWVALLGYDDKLTPFKCGGTLISARHVITAAHCITDDLTFVRLGDHDLTTDTEISHVDIKIEKMEKHPDFNLNNRYGDIGILYLEHNVQLSESINPICMPTSPELRQKSYINYTPFIAGWGKTMEGGLSATVQQELQIPIFDNQLCRDRYKQKNVNFPEKQFDNAVLCAGALATANGTCHGDSGGSLMMPERYNQTYRFYLIGVLSHGPGCQRPEIPSLYTSTQYFIDWILEKVADTP